MKAITVRTLETKTHPETKMLFWFVFAGTRGGDNRIRIISLLRNTPLNTHQISTELGLDYKLIQHHVKVLEKNNLISKFGEKYGSIYYVSELFQQGEQVFNEIQAKIRNTEIPQLLTR